MNNKKVIIILVAVVLVIIFAVTCYSVMVNKSNNYTSNLFPPEDIVLSQNGTEVGKGLKRMYSWVVEGSGTNSTVNSMSVNIDEFLADKEPLLSVSLKNKLIVDISKFDDELYNNINSVSLFLYGQDGTYISEEKLKANENKTISIDIPNTNSGTTLYYEVFVSINNYGTVGYCFKIKI